MNRKQKVQYIDFSPAFAKQLLAAVNPHYGHDEIKCHRVGLFYGSTFNVWQKSNPKMKMETTITKKTLSELETAIINYLK